MAIPLTRSRSGCALHGALFTAAAIDGVTPLLHSTPGCGVQAYQSALAGGGCLGDDRRLAVPSSNLSEKHIVFGGGSRLREQVKNAIGLVDGELTVVLSGCPAEMIGDDVAAMVQDVRNQGEPAIEIATAGFRGSAYQGYEAFLKGVIAQRVAFDPAPGGTRVSLVNILGIVPQQDAFWLAELDELSRMLAGIGLHANSLFGPDGGVDSLRALPQAELSLVVSPWGLEPARALQSRFGIPWLQVTGLPVGADASVDLLRRVAGLISPRPAEAESYLAKEIRREAYLLDAVAEALYRRQAQRDFAVVAPSLHAAGLSRFLTETLGWTARATLITDDPAPEVRDALAESLAEVQFIEDAGGIDDILRGSGAEIVLGSAIERSVADELGIPLIEVAVPTGKHRLVAGLGGFRGGLALIEQILAIG
ncbi:nitrogenase molybdenum-iron protein beta chain [Rhodopseudomonas rhenobacensis]|uniref:Nitrogenase molybdenum-iron protein beta chain n=1 Tax=Rhodopseudomonas rhenobacensis TaxID=87461 RepID=A0A7W8DYL9_9BRAD|nr:nitrogenase component 1 [Rhodopseudomonas rhenobacensis]MBB5046952.1 nitrogenase molybdenum-iron protein beta chain [Rhodopseudomonas rhenobacensis]